MGLAACRLPAEMGGIRQGSVGGNLSLVNLIRLVKQHLAAKEFIVPNATKGLAARPQDGFLRQSARASRTWSSISANQY
jgi:hypothetical protein